MQIVRSNAQLDHDPSDRPHPVAAAMAEQRVAAAGPRHVKVRAGRKRSSRGSHNDPAPNRDRPLASVDFAQMAVLGIVHEGFSTFGEIVPAAKSVARPDWQPTADVLASAVEGALKAGYLDSTGAGYALTRDGHAVLVRYVQAPLASARGRSARTATALKLCFLEALDADQRESVIEDLARLQHAELRALLEGCETCPASGRCTRLWMAREIERIKSEMAWLDTLKVEIADGS